MLADTIPDQVRHRLPQIGFQVARDAFDRVVPPERCKAHRPVHPLDHVEQLAFDLKRGLLRRDEDQRRPIRRPGQGGAHFGKTAESLAAAGGAEKEAH